LSDDFLDLRLWPAKLACRETYPSSNFVGGAFAVIVDPNIQSEGTCRQFRSFWPEHTSSTNIHGIKYAQTLFVGAAAGTASAVHYFHTFQNGLCYEFDFDFNEENGTGMDLPCSMQWMSDRSESESMQQFLSQISFLTPQLKQAPSERTGRSLLPSIASFEHSLAEGHLSRSLFGSMLGMIAALPLPHG
jgi:hypothetical protein